MEILTNEHPYQHQGRYLLLCSQVTLFVIEMYMTVQNMLGCSIENGKRSGRGLLCSIHFYSTLLRPPKDQETMRRTIFLVQFPYVCIHMGGMHGALL